MASSDDFSVEFRDWGELRMGSPFNTYSVTFTGRWKPDLKSYNLPISPEHGWSNLNANSDDRRYYALIVWDLLGNTPGFHVVTFDTQMQSIKLSERYLGLPHDFRWHMSSFRIESLIIVKPT